MVSIKHYLFLFLLPFLLACTKNEFTLEFDMAPDVTDNFNVTYYATDINGGRTVQAVASVRDGKCVLTGVTKLPTLVYITTRRSAYPLVIYAEKGNKLKITGQQKEPLEWNVEGNIPDKEMSEWRLENLKFLTGNEQDSVNNAVREYVEENPQNPVSVILMLSYFNRVGHEKEYIDLIGELRGEARDANWLNILGRADQYQNLYFYPARLESLVMRSNKEGADTLELNGHHPALLLMWQTGSQQRREMIDSLKILEKEYKDSSLFLADLCLDVDSMAWKNSIRKDSLKVTKRFWVPTGMADPTVTKLKVPSLPYYIVFDSLGSQAFRTKDLSLALEEYRKMMKK